ncbi:MAG: FAD-binding oxidoreductase [Deltaproteobacteria bacterium]|nr:FAD-binding oxidoreductase [Deltaproteobacteria bacterium]
MDIDKLASDIEKIVSKEYISTNLFERIKSSMDVFPYEAERENLPYLVVMPANKDEISRILIYANEHDIPVYIRGSGTSFTGASARDCHYDKKA